MSTLKNKVLNFKDVNGNTLIFQPNNTDKKHIVSGTHLNFSGNTLKSDTIKIKDKSVNAEFTDADTNDVGTDSNGIDIANILPRLVEALDATHILQLDGVPNVTKSAVFANRIKEISNTERTSLGIRNKVFTDLQTELNTYSDDRTDIFRLYATALLAIANVRLSGSGASAADADAEIEIKLNLAKRQHQYAHYIKQRLSYFGNKSTEEVESGSTELKSNQLYHIAGWRLSSVPYGSYSKSNIELSLTGSVQSIASINTDINNTYSNANKGINDMDNLLMVELDFFLRRISDNWITGTGDNAISGLGDINYVFSADNTNILNIDPETSLRMYNTERVALIDGSDEYESISVELDTKIANETISIKPLQTSIKSLDNKVVTNIYNTTTGVYINDVDGTNTNYKVSHIYSNMLGIIYHNYSAEIQENGSRPALNGFSYDTLTTIDPKLFINLIVDVADDPTGKTLAHDVPFTIPTSTTTFEGFVEVHIVHSVVDKTTSASVADYDSAGILTDDVYRIRNEYSSTGVAHNKHIETNNISIKERINENNIIFDDLVDQMRELGWLSYISQ